MADADPDVELVEPVAVPVVVVFELPLGVLEEDEPDEVLEEEELDEAGAALEVGAGAGEDGAVELPPLCEGVVA